MLIEIEQSGKAEPDLRAAGSSREIVVVVVIFSIGVGHSNFVLRVRQSHARSFACAANAGFSDLTGFSGRYYVAPMDVKSEAGGRRDGRKRCPRQPDVRFTSHMILVAWIRITFCSRVQSLRCEIRREKICEKTKRYSVR